ncbi:1,4-alpha-glucan branching enzyme GlgB [Talaromyces islandicus]|uniref:1,4-alpha-glucan branching enzyme GlgB n=1 Tax=Talaromyces islandicus TaxID=28573 RepID=A0A0U1LKN9_TALIS|nr:1,4-alpha-glucan branching enzyme GlgB [Talaromyces islandicus]
MGDALDLNLFPSCYNCLSWSEDGELAIAAGDAVHLQLPQWKPKWVHPLFEKEKSTPWTSTKIRTNVFTHREWEVSWPSNRDDFSIGAEQSLSTVAALAWSPQGLGKHRRCVLAVLTSNLVLSLYEADGQRRTWSRVAIVNDAVEAYFRVAEKKKKNHESSARNLQNLQRKGRVRAFAWCSPLKSENGHDDHGNGSVRWGEQVLAVATDDNDVVLVQVERDVSSVDKSVYSFNVVSHLTLDQQAKRYPMTPGPSLWADALEQKARILHVACGPWRKMATPAGGFGAMIAVVYGSTLQLVNIQANTVVAGKDGEKKIKAQISQTPEKWLSGLNLDRANFTGPIGWIPSDDNRILLVVGCLGGRATIWYDTSAYLNQSTDENQPVFRQHSFQEEGSGFFSMGAEYYQHNEPMTGIVALNNPDTPKVYITTLGPVSETIALSVIGTPLEETVAMMRSPWIEHMERYRQRYNIQYELGDMTVARTWGLATFRGWLAVAFSMHPGDVLEYTIRAEENTVVLFVNPDDPDAVFPEPPNNSEEHVAAARDEILRLILSSAHELQKNDTRSARLVYAACMCAIITSQPQDQNDDQNQDQIPLLTLTQNALTHLSSTFDLPITEELSYCADIASTTPATTTDMQDARSTVLIPSKPTSVLEGPGGWIFESCQTCHRRKNEVVGLNWTGYGMAVCANGHRWNRCRLTFLAIQEPYISLFCSACDTNCLARNRGVGYTLSRGDVVMADNNDEQTENIIKGENAENNWHEAGEEGTEKGKRVELYDRLYDRYDVCAYCGGKYQDE